MGNWCFRYRSLGNMNTFEHTHMEKYLCSDFVHIRLDHGESWMVDGVYHVFESEYTVAENTEYYVSHHSGKMYATDNPSKPKKWRADYYFQLNPKTFKIETTSKYMIKNS